jgi:hypothetical protein
VTENNQKKVEKQKRRKRKNKESPLYPMPTHRDSRKTQEINQTEEDMNETKKNDKGTGEKKKSPESCLCARR